MGIQKVQKASHLEIMIEVALLVQIVCIAQTEINENVLNYSEE